jgi:uncharacterized repeat protein (TIGR01451 family)
VVAGFALAAGGVGAGARAALADAPPGDLTVQLTADNPKPQPGDWVDYIIRVRNTGGTRVAVNVVVNFEAPSGSVVDDADHGSTVVCGINNLATAPGLRCTVPSIAPGGAAEIRALTHAPSTAGRHTATVRIDPAGLVAERNESNNSASAEISVGERPWLYVQFESADEVTVGTTPSRFVAYVDNRGRADAQQVTVDLNAPRGFRLRDASVMGGTCGGSDTSQRCTVQRIAADSSATLNFAVEHLSAPPGDYRVDVRVDRQNTVDEVDGRYHQATALVHVVPSVRPDLAIVSSRPEWQRIDRQDPSSPIIFSVANLGTGDATNAVAKVTVPHGLTITSAGLFYAASLGPQCPVSGRTATCTFDLSAQENRNAVDIRLTVDGSSAAAGMHQIVAELDPRNSIAESTGRNNRGEVVVEITEPRPDLVVLADLPVERVVPHDRSSTGTRFWVRNLGVSDALGAVVEFTAPAGFAFDDVDSSDQVQCVRRSSTTIRCRMDVPVTVPLLAVIVFVHREWAPPGSYVLAARIDPDNAVRESDGGNNRAEIVLIVPAEES